MGDLGFRLGKILEREVRMGMHYDGVDFSSLAGAAIFPGLVVFGVGFCSTPLCLCVVVLSSTAGCADSFFGSFWSYLDFWVRWFWPFL